MAAGKARTDAQKDRAKDLRYQHKYGITLADVTERRRQQNNRCKCCGIEFGPDQPPYVDHYHFKIVTERTGVSAWEAKALDEMGRKIFAMYDRTKAGAVRALKAIALPWSVRGLLCFKCNRGLGFAKFFDAERRPDNLNNVIVYLKIRLT